MHHKTLIALVGLALGITVGEYVSYASEIAIASCLLGFVQVALYYFEIHHVRKSELQKTLQRFSIPLYSGIFFLFIALGIIRMQFIEQKSSFVCDSSCTFQAMIVGVPKVQDVYQIFAVRPKVEDEVYDIQVKAPLYPHFGTGDHLLISGKVTTPYALMEHGGTKVFDYTRYLRLHNIGSETLYPKIVQIKIDQTKNFTWDRFVPRLENIKETLVTTIGLHVRDPAKALAVGMLFGDSSMSKELTQTFRTVGLSHIVVLSGFNIAILISFVLFVLMFLPLFVRVFFATMFVALFVLAVGAEASIIRATLMSFIALLALLIGRAYTARQALLLSLLLIILYEPEHLSSDVSLHLSFLATAGIVYFSESIKNLLSSSVSKVYKEIIASTFSAYLATLPYVMYTFGTVSVYALLANIIVLPLVPLSMLITFLITLLSPLTHIFGILFGYADTLLLDTIIFFARTIEKLPFSRVEVTISFGEMCIGYGLIIVVFLLLRTRRNDSLIKNETSKTKDGEIISGIIPY